MGLVAPPHQHQVVLAVEVEEISQHRFGHGVGQAGQSSRRSSPRLGSQLVSPRDSLPLQADPIPQALSR